MRKLAVVLTIFLVSILFMVQQKFGIAIQDVTVSVRVFDGDRFVDDLALDDFEILEDGRPQKIMSLYLTRKSKVERMEGRDVLPFSGRSFYFIFKLYENHPTIAEALEFYFADMYQPDDQLVLITPLKVYELDKDVVAANPKESVVEYMQGIIRKDTLSDSQEYNAVIKDLTRNVQSVVSGDVIRSLREYRQNLRNLELITLQDGNRLADFASQVKGVEGQKNVFYFCQSEFRPLPSSRNLAELLDEYRNSVTVYSELQNAFTYYRKEASLDIEKLTRDFSDSGLLFNFINLNIRPTTVGGTIQWLEHSEDVYEAFSKLAVSTGGVAENSLNPAAALKRSADLSESYYVLYYSPDNYLKDGKYKNLSVRIRGQNYKVYHRLGYVAD